VAALGLLVVTYGISLWVALITMLRSNGPVAGCILLVIFLGMFFALVIPMTMRMIEGASKTLDFEPPQRDLASDGGTHRPADDGHGRGRAGRGLDRRAMIAFRHHRVRRHVPPLMALMFRIDFLKGGAGVRCWGRCFT
jgi:hypothetical protein